MPSFNTAWLALYLLVGNGTLNKHAGIDYKQLSFMTKINENHSGEVNLVLIKKLNESLHVTVFNLFEFVVVAVEGSLAGERDCRESASRSGLDHQKESRL